MTIQKLAFGVYEVSHMGKTKHFVDSTFLRMVAWAKMIQKLYHD